MKKDVTSLLNHFIKEDKSSNNLIIEEEDIPHVAFPHHTIQVPNTAGFFGEQNNRVDFEYVSSVYLMDYQFKHPQECFGMKEPFAASFDIPPILGNDDILYHKQADTLYKISLDADNPCFQKIDLRTKEVKPLSLPIAQEIVKSWIKNEEKANLISKKLAHVFRTSNKEERLMPKKKKTLPHFSDAYRFFGLKECFKQDAKQLVLLNKNFPMNPIMTKGKRLILKKNDIYYKIEFGDKVKFERLSPLGHYVMTEQDLLLMLGAMKKSNTFHEKTGAICSALRMLYKQTEAPKFIANDVHQIPLNSTIRTSELSKILLKTGFNKNDKGI